MTTLTATWTNPVKAANQNPIAGVQVLLAVAAASPVFSLIATVPAPGATFTQTSIDAGDYILRLVVVDTKGLIGNPVDTSFNVPAAVPGQVTNVQISVA